ncbi:hypothetical protein [Janthinobacterium agaricidamnosum]|uniref:Peptidase M17 leucyl aminopeptidase domain protein n=1 Tax=Janthinobacterium agaricidamnosum NBRC 102515 = DSM 9628 TaxID=1349767 RepID=W0V4K5_9BURK|nr:hypothetical protein [Janthinobacterium agaricidamnosum]CDG82811.1 peptidase M17 leucyl aminopeptidase domain protein [Janthinobacterium agaricidamnosum NBRC 102515 = DSM 9628]
MSLEHLARPLSSALSSACATRRTPGWSLDSHLGNDADKACLAGLIGSRRDPALLLTASHGVGFPAGDARQASCQGALLCQDWPGPLAHAGALPPAFFFSGEDARRGPSPAGLVSLHFACYSAGTPQFDNFAAGTRQAPRRIAAAPMLAPLAQQLLGHAGGGALAFIGHVDRAWGYSFMWPGAKAAQIGMFEDLLCSLMDGYTVGHAMDIFGLRHAVLAAGLTEELGRIRNGRKIDHARIAGMWTALNDARNYVIVGDPAVRLAALA